MLSTTKKWIFRFRQRFWCSSNRKEGNGCVFALQEQVRSWLIDLECIQVLVTVPLQSITRRVLLLPQDQI